MAAIEVQDLEKAFGDVKAVDGISFEVPEGQLFGFLGPNGAGKTTLISILCTLLAPTNGSARVAGFDVVKQSHQVRRSIGVIFQEPSLDERLTAIENLQFHARIYGLSQKTARPRMDELLESLELSAWRKKLVKTFSGGMKRRLEIARGLLHDPHVLFLDEPTLGLDPQARNYLWEHILRLRKEHGITVFLTTHYMEEAEVCDRVSIIDKGKLIANDTPKSLKRDVGAEIVKVEVEGDPNDWKPKFEKEYGFPVHTADGKLIVEVKDAERFLPVMFNNFREGIISVSLRKASLEDVFLKLTGKALRDEEINDMQRMKDLVRMKRH